MENDVVKSGYIFIENLLKMISYYGSKFEDSYYKMTTYN